MKKKTLLLSVLVLAFFAASSHSARIDDYFEYAKKNEALLGAFLNKMPKGVQIYSLKQTAQQKPQISAQQQEQKNQKIAVPPATDYNAVFKEIFAIAANQNVLYAQIIIPVGKQDIEALLDSLSKSAQATSENVKKHISGGIILSVDKNYWTKPVDSASERDYLLYFSSQVSQAAAAAARYGNRGINGIEIFANPLSKQVSDDYLNNQLNIISRYWAAYQSRGAEINISFKNSPSDVYFSEGFKDKIGKITVLGHLKRVNPGSEIVLESALYNLLRHLYENKIAVEIGGIANFSAENNPFILYRDGKIPMIIRPESEFGLIEDFIKTAQILNLSYKEIKDIVFNSLEYSFIPGESAFENGDYSKAKKSLPQNSQKAALQKRLLDDFAEFEQNMDEAIRLNFPNILIGTKK